MIPTRVGLAPVVWGAAVADPRIAHAGAAHEPDPPVRHQNPPVIPVIDVADSEHAQGMEHLDLAAGFSHGLAEALGHLVRTGGVEQDVNFHTGTATLGECLCHFLGDGALLVEVVRERDGLTRPADRL